MKAYLITMRGCDSVVSIGETPWRAVQNVIRSFRNEDPEWDGDETDLEQLQEVGDFIRWAEFEEDASLRR